jgi:hypothetical protein
LPRSEDSLQRQIAINLQLRRQLETARRDAVEYCAKWCEDHVEQNGAEGKSLKPVRMAEGFTHAGELYAAGLRGIIGK